MDTESFAQLCKAYQAGDAQAEHRLFTSFLPRIVGLANKYLHSRSENKDVVQSVLVSFIANHATAIGKMERPDELWDLFAAITLRHCHKHNKRRAREKKRGRVVSLDMADSRPSADSAPGYDPADDALAPDMEAALHDLFTECSKELSDRQQQVLGMRLAGMDRKEIAEALQVAVPTVDRELNRIKTALRGLAESEST